MRTEHKRKKLSGLSFCVFLLGLCLSLPALGLPKNPRFSENDHGQVSFALDGALVITQASPHLVISWETFDVAPDEEVRFLSLVGDNATTINIVEGKQKNGNAGVSSSAADIFFLTFSTSSESKINGNITSRHQVFIVNSKGIQFGFTAKVKVVGLLASVDPGIANYVASLGANYQGDYIPVSYNLDSGGKVKNKGELVSDSFIILVGQSLINTGSLIATGIQEDAVSRKIILLASKDIVNSGSININKGHIQFISDSGSITHEKGTGNGLIASFCTSRIEIGSDSGVPNNSHPSSMGVDQLSDGKELRMVTRPRIVSHYGNGCPRNPACSSAAGVSVPEADSVSQSTEEEVLQDTDSVSESVEEQVLPSSSGGLSVPYASSPLSCADSVGPDAESVASTTVSLFDQRSFTSYPLLIPENANTISFYSPKGHTNIHGLIKANPFNDEETILRIHAKVPFLSTKDISLHTINIITKSNINIHCGRHGEIYNISPMIMAKLLESNHFIIEHEDNLKGVIDINGLTWQSGSYLILKTHTVKINGLFGSKSHVALVDIYAAQFEKGSSYGLASIEPAHFRRNDFTQGGGQPSCRRRR